MHQLESADSVLKDYKGVEKEETIGEKILEAVSSEEWKSPKEIFELISYYDSESVHRQTFSRHLQALESLGKLETRGKRSSIEYRRADKPVQETREDYSSPLSEGIPDFMERRIEEEVEKRVREEVSKLEDLLEQKVKMDLDYGDKNLSSNKKKSSGESKRTLESKSVADMIIPILKEADEGLSGSEVSDEWNKRYEHQRSRRSIRRYLNRLADRGLVNKEGSKNSTQYSYTG
jgi:predicted HTH transcriptional regulator